MYGQLSCPAVRRYFTKTFAKLGYIHDHHYHHHLLLLLLISGERLKAESWGVLEENATRKERGESIFMLYVCYLVG